MSGTHLFYNGVLLRDCEMKQWRQEIVYDESHTDILYSRVTLGVESMLVSLQPTASGYMQQAGGFNAPWSSIAVPFVDGETIVDRWREIQWRLQEARKDFWLAVNGATTQPQPGRVIPPGSPPGTPSQPPLPADDGYFNDSYRVVLAATGLSTADLSTLAEQPEGNADQLLGFIGGFSDRGDGNPKTKILRNKVIDLNNGPKPMDVSVEQVFGGRALRVSFTIEICRCFCRPTLLSSTEVPPVQDATKVKGVVSNRWSVTESLDAEWKTSHTVEGKLIVADARYKPHAMRLMVTPRLIPYARIESRSFATDRSNLALSYKYEIRETGPAAPEGVVDWDGTYTERAARGGKRLADISVRVTGQVNPVLGAGSPDPLKQHKVALLAIAYRIARSRIRWSSRHNTDPGKTPQTTMVMDMVVAEQMAKPTVELRVSVLYNEKSPAGKLASDNFGLRLENIGASLSNSLQGVMPYDDRYWPEPDPFPWDVESAQEDAQENEEGTFYDCYYQTPCSQWHSMPRGAVPPESIERSGSTRYSVDPNLTANLGPDETPPGQLIDSSLQGWSDGQVDFAYLECKLDTKYELGSGKVQLPLSKTRQLSTSLPAQTCVVVSLHAGIAQRIVSMVATRIGKWPQVPAPQVAIQRGNMVETYLDGEVINDAPKLTKDGKTYLYSSQIRWVYAMSRLPNQAGDTIRTASNPMDKTTPDGNKIRLTDYFTYGEVEEGDSGSPLIA